MSPDALGMMFALLNALTWACALVLFKHSGQRMSPLALNLFKNIVGIVLIAATLALLPLLPSLPDRLHQSAPVWIHDLTSHEMIVLVISGILGIAIADTIFFYGLNLAGVGLIAITDCTYTPFVMLCSWLLLGEPPTVVHLIGAALIVAAVLFSTGHAPPADRTRRQILLGMLLATIAVALMAFGIVYATPVLRTAPALWTAMVRLIGGTAVLALLAPITPGLREVVAVLRPSRMWKAALPASIFGAYLAMVFWVAGFSLTNPSIAATLNQSSSIIALILAAIFLHERLTRRKITSVVLATAGVLLMMLHEHVQGWIGHWRAAA